MRILIDTTYILPLIGLNIKGISTEKQILRLIEGEDEILVNRLSLFEALGKARGYLTDEGSRARIERGFTAILGSDRLQVLPVVDEKTLPLVLNFLMKGTKDVPDAAIMASAIIHADILLTEARDIPVLLRDCGAEMKCSKLVKFLRA